MYDTIYRRSVDAATKINPERMTVHKVKLPELFVFAKMGEQHKDWPTTFKHNGMEFTFASNEAMPNFPNVANEYSGYARYVNKDYKAPLPINHKEFGAYMFMLGTHMRNENVSLNEAHEWIDTVQKSRVPSNLSIFAQCDEERAHYIIEHCWMKLKAVNFDSIAAPDSD